jgi:hypothetical protein
MCKKAPSASVPGFGRACSPGQSCWRARAKKCPTWKIVPLRGWPAPVALDFRRYRELREGVDHGHEVEVEQRRSSNQLAVCEVPPATDPHQHRVRRRASKVVDKAVVVLGNPPCGVVGLRRHEALDGNPVRHGPLGVGIEVQGLVEDHRPNDRLRRGLKFGHPAVVALVAEGLDRRGEERLSGRLTS